MSWIKFSHIIRRVMDNCRGVHPSKPMKHSIYIGSSYQIFPQRRRKQTIVYNKIKYNWAFLSRFNKNNWIFLDTIGPTAIGGPLWKLNLKFNFWILTHLAQWNNSMHYMRLLTTSCISEHTCKNGAKPPVLGWVASVDMCTVVSELRGFEILV